MVKVPEIIGGLLFQGRVGHGKTDLVALVGAAIIAVIDLAVIVGANQTRAGVIVDAPGGIAVPDNNITAANII